MGGVSRPYYNQLLKGVFGLFRQPSLEEQQRVLSEPFDPNVHEKTFMHYLEVIILPDGTVEYAVPSHVLKLTKIYGKSQDEMFEEYYNGSEYLDPVEWLCKKTGCISVWNNGYAGNPNPQQLKTLQMLKDKKLYEGEIKT